MGDSPKVFPDGCGKPCQPGMWTKKIAKVSGRKGRQLGKCLVERVICEFLMTEIFMSGFYGHVGH